jgi:tetratricopeptide (TPR) repeat protein
VAEAEERFGEAAQRFEQAIALDPSFTKAYANRAVLILRSGDRARALLDLNRAIELDPSYLLAYRLRARCFFDLENYRQAFRDYTYLIENAPASAHNLTLRGLSYHYLKRYEPALADFNRAAAIDPNYAWIWVCRGCALERLGETEQALADYDRAIALDPKYAHAWFLRGSTREEQREWELALADYNRSLELEPGIFAVLYRRGRCHFLLEKLDEALADLNAAVEINPNHRAARRWRATTWEALGNDEAAAADRAVADPDTENEPADENDEFEDELEDDASEGAAIASNDTPAEETKMAEPRQSTQALLQKHFAPMPIDQITITERTFPLRMRADLQRALDGLVSTGLELLHFCGIRQRYAHEGINFADLLVRDHNNPVTCVPPQFEEVNIGEAEPIRCLKQGLWLLREKEIRLAVTLQAESHYSEFQRLRMQVATANTEEGTQSVQRFYKRLEQAVAESHSYRGKILSLEFGRDYSGQSTGILVHKLRTVAREQVILPRATLELLERNVIRFVEQRERLGKLGLATKKGLLFYGPPGTGKTHTIHYLAGALPGHTTLLISAEQVGLLSEYMTLARLLQPSLVVIEDADLIARDREEMQSPCEEVLLNKLLNEMDGLKANADILFLLTTNRPQSIEAALASRPGRIDQAIEFPLPDADGRRKLIQLYSGGSEIPADVLEQTVVKTENVSAAFIKELLRRAMQFHLEHSDDNRLDLEDIHASLEEMLFAGGSLNRKILGAQE